MNNSYCVVNKGVIFLFLSDYFLVYCIIKVGVVKVVLWIIEYCLYKYYDKEFFFYDFRVIDWFFVYCVDNVNEVVNMWCIIYFSIVD